MKNKQDSEILRDELHAARKKLAARSETLKNAEGRIVQILRTVGHPDPQPLSVETSASSKAVLERYRHLLSQSEKLRKEIQDLIKSSRRIRSESMEPFKRSPKVTDLPSDIPRGCSPDRPSPFPFV